MPSFKNIIFFLIALIFNFILLYLFFLDFYVLYFIFLVIFAFSIFKNYYYSFFTFSLLSVMVVFIINLKIYDEAIFELLLYLNLLEDSIYVNSEVMYVLILLHYFFLLNLKKFEKFWDIIDSKLLNKGWS